jgi:hypothetical protein
MPEAEAVCVHGDFDEALAHLTTRTIYIYNAEEVRGGGFLKYCRLLTKGFRVGWPNGHAGGSPGHDY